ncbi:MAG: hypothetical protein CM15mP12_7760 [Gammaproteobacteria bacterium]|nr:MAG: hypothetical protein CM15mP12_7760 [Gammaproteobacteria bacterium]
MRDGFDRSYLQNLDEEAEAQENFVGSPDNLEGVLAFVEKRKTQILKANNYIIENFSDHHLDDVIQIERLSNPTPWKEETFKSVLSSRHLAL